MRIIKNINHNFALAEDDAGNRLIVSGKGIGFGAVPREVTDLGMINRSYYDVDETYISMLNDLPQKIIEVSAKIVDRARLLIDNPISSNIIFTLADHIHFSIQRYKKHMNIKLPILYDIQHLFEREMKAGEYGLEIIQKDLKVYLPKEEAAYIALHLINAEEKMPAAETDDELVVQITRIIEQEYGITIDRNNFNYSRFVSHMHYLFKREKEKILFETENIELYNMMKENYPKTYQCSEKVCAYLESSRKMKLTDEEKLYMMLHINRLCTREDGNQ